MGCLLLFSSSLSIRFYKRRRRRFFFWCITETLSASGFGDFSGYREVVGLRQMPTTRHRSVLVDPQVSPWIVYSYFSLRCPSVFIKEGSVYFFGVS